MEQRKVVFKVFGSWSLAICLSIGVLLWQRRAVDQAEKQAQKESHRAKVAFIKAYGFKSRAIGAKR